MIGASPQRDPHEPGVADRPAAFSHLRVLDLSETLSGAYAARMFGDFGADVLLAEPPEGHPLRDEPPFLDDRPGLDRSVMHGYVNWNKRSVVVRNADAVERLAETADVLVTDAMRPCRRRLPVPSMRFRRVDSPFHYATRPGRTFGSGLRQQPDGVRAHRLVHHQPARGRAAAATPVRQTGYIAGVAGFVAVAAALWRRERTGAGESVDVSRSRRWRSPTPRGRCLRCLSGPTEWSTDRMAAAAAGNRRRCGRPPMVR